MKMLLSFLAALGFSLSAPAQQPGGPGGQPHMGPPPEAYAACKGRKDGDGASLDTPRGRMQGKCRLVFVPEAPPQQPPQQPPQGGGYGQRPPMGPGR